MARDWTYEHYKDEIPHKPSQMPELKQRESDLACAMDAGFMLSTAYGQKENQRMPVSDSDTLYKFADLIRAASVPSDKERAEALKAIYSDPKMDALTMGEVMIEYRDVIKQALTAPDQSEYEAVCEDLDRAHDHIKLYVEAEERYRETIKALVEALKKAQAHIQGESYYTAFPEIEQALALAEKGGV